MADYGRPWVFHGIFAHGIAVLTDLELQWKKCAFVIFLPYALNLLLFLFNRPPHLLITAFSWNLNGALQVTRTSLARNCQWILPQDIGLTH